MIKIKVSNHSYSFLYTLVIVKERNFCEQWCRFFGTFRDIKKEATLKDLIMNDFVYFLLNKRMFLKILNNDDFFY